MTKEEFLFLFEKHLNGTGTREELERLENFIDGMELPDDTWNDRLGIRSDIYQEIKNRLETSKQLQRAEAQPRRKNWGWMKVAAIILIATASALTYLLVKNQPRNTTTQLVNNVHILPARNTATLISSDGKKVILDDVKAGDVLKESGADVKKQSDGVLVYDKNAASANGQTTRQNQLATPKGGVYAVVLSDGTKVWLNSATTLTFPAVFSGNTRSVKLNGEAYFEVAKNKEKPFYVTFEHSQIKVLGTHFNISSYNDDAAQVVTLMEGSVLVNRDDKQALLKPGQQAVLSGQHKSITVADADVDNAMAWRNNVFIFNDEPLTEVMKKIARWYNVEIQYEGDFSDEKLGGTFSRNKPIENLLTNINSVDKIHFKIEGRRVIVMK